MLEGKEKVLESLICILIMKCSGSEVTQHSDDNSLCKTSQTVPAKHKDAGNVILTCAKKAKILK